MTDQLDLSLTTKDTYYLFIDGANAGYFTPDTLEINGELMTDILSVDQIEQEDARIEYKLIDPTINVTFAQDGLALLYNLLMPLLVGFRAGVDGPAFGWGDLKVSAESASFKLELIPVSNEPGSKLKSYRMQNAYLPAQTIAQLKGKGRFGTLPVIFKSKFDKDAPRGFEYLWHGNLNAEGDAPRGIILTASNRQRPEPAVSLPTMGIAAGTFDRLNSWLYYSSAGSVTAEIDDAGDITNIQTDITYNALAGGEFVAGNIINIEDEDMYIISKTDTVLTVVRAYGGTENVAHVDGLTITLRTTVYFWPGNNIVSYNSTSPANMTVGDVVGATDATEKGRLTNVSQDGSDSNITASSQGTTSPILFGLVPE